ncbi:MAG: hypothetical protein M3169_05030 [Candidatus Eremiobacteraeota bacterium]|nr:hypothetical protein [Candidatus Eremiobacteraeota bacterium]
MATSALGWPDPYLPVPDPTMSAPAPTWSKDQVIAAGLTLARLFVADRVFADKYHEIVRWYYAHKTDPILSECTARYAEAIFTALRLPPQTTFNEHDFANLHRAMWLFLLESFVCLVDKNPHGDWGDPKPPAVVSRGENEMDAAGRPKCFHNIPNQRGYFALTSGDMPNPAPVTS